jgi:hypothetical protein
MAMDCVWTRVGWIGPFGWGRGEVELVARGLAHPIRTVSGQKATMVASLSVGPRRRRHPGHGRCGRGL